MPRSLRAPERGEVGEIRFAPAFPPKGLSRIEAAHHIRVSPTLFDEMVRDGRMPPPKLLNSRVVWDRVKIEAFFEALPDRQIGQAEASGDSFADWQ